MLLPPPRPGTGRPDDEDGLVPDGVEDEQVVAPHGAVDVVATEVPRPCAPLRGSGRAPTPCATPDSALLWS
jgi:hypothetical protein